MAYGAGKMSAEVRPITSHSSLMPDTSQLRRFSAMKRPRRSFMFRHSSGAASNIALNVAAFGPSALKKALRRLFFPRIVMRQFSCLSCV